MSGGLWFRDRQVWRLIFLRYLPLFAGLNLVWETAHVRLYTLWYEAQATYIAFSILHCTLGDMLIGAAALFIALIAARAGPAARWPWRRIGVLSALIGLAYTVFSEWMNVTWLRSWTYAESMPKVEVAGFELGLTPVAQWLVVPPLALYLCRVGLSRDLARTFARRRRASLAGAATAQDANEDHQDRDQQTDHQQPAQ